MSVTPISKAASWRRLVERPEDVGPVEEFLGRFEMHLRARPAAPKTIDRYMRASRQLGQWLGGADVAGLTRTDMEGYIVHRRETTSPATAATDFVSLQQFFKFVKLDLGATGSGFTSPMDGMVTPRFVPPVIEVVEEDFLALLIRQAERGAAYEDLRDAAILRMFVDTGCRLSEVTGLTLNRVANAPLLTVIGKSKGHGPVPREVEVGTKALRALRKYLRARAHHPSAELPDVWLGKRGPMTPNGVRQMIRKRSRALGHHVNPHRFRHTKADNFLANGGSEGDLMRLMGWRSDEMPKRYGAVRAGQRALEAQRRMGFQGDAV